MKNLITILLTVLFVLPLASAAFAGGGGPPKDLLTGVFTQVDPVERTAVFQKNGTEETRVLLLAQSMEADDIPLNKKVMVTLDKHVTDPTIETVSIMFMDMTLNRVVALIMVGLIGGLLSGFIGSGGAFVLTPAMMSLGVPGAIAVASNMCHKFPKAMVGSYKRWKYGQADIKLGLVMAGSAIFGVQIGVNIQKFILHHWGNAGSNLYVSVVFVFILVTVGAFVLMDAWKLLKGGTVDVKVSKLALAMQKIKIPPMIHFKTADITISAWVTLPVGLATGMLAATIAVGGFIGVPGLIYVLGASAIVASASELIIAFVMGAWGSIQWGLSGLIDIRMTLLILSASLIGVQLGALGTTYVKDYMIKLVMAAVMLIVAVSRGSKIPGYLADLGLRAPLDSHTAFTLNQVSFWALVAALATAGVIISVAMIRGMLQAKAEESAKAQEAISHAQV